jgi:SAM-dependent methyltransferase
METPYFPDLGDSDEINWPLSEMQLIALTEFKSRLNSGHYKFHDVDSLCGARACAEEALLLAKRDRYGLQVHTWLSRRSGMLWTSPRMDMESLQSFYRNDYRIIYSGRSRPGIGFYCEQVARGRAIISWLNPRVPKDFFRDGVVFDVGCGSGGMLEPFKDFGWATYGCDFGNEYINYGKDKGLTLKTGGIEELETFGKAKLILLSHVLEHEASPSALLHAASNSLEDGGFLIISLPGIMNLRAYDWQLIRYLQNAHLFHFSKTTLEVLANKSGFRVVSADESIRMLLVKDKSLLEKNWDSGEYERILTYLRSPKTFSDSLKSIVKNAFKSVGLSVTRIGT